MGALVGVILEFLSSLLGRLFTVEVAKFLAYKVLLSFLVFSGLVIVYQLIISMTLDWVSQLIQQYASNQSVVLSVAGVGGWLLVHLRIADCFSIITSAMTYRLVLRMLPFSPVK